MIPGFKKRLMQELCRLIESLGEFEELKETAKYLLVRDVCFPGNCLPWVGASLLSSLNNEIDRFLLTFEEYSTNGNVIPDRHGQAFITATRHMSYFNRDFEESLKIQKQILYSNTTPYSARSLASKREPIAVMMQKSLQKMDMI
jgi:actin-related protein